MFIAVANSFSVCSVPRALATGCCGSLYRMPGSSILDYSFGDKRKNRTHLSRIRPVSRSSLPSSSRMFSDLTSFISSSRISLIFWKNPCSSPMRNSFSNSSTWCSKKRTSVSCTSHCLQPVTCVPGGLPQLRIPSVYFQALSGCVHPIIDACSSASV